jgi:mono/diheme cytochrome c family protein
MRLLLVCTVPAILAGVSWFGLVMAADAPKDKQTADKKPPEKVTADHAKKIARGLDVFKKHVRPLLTSRCLNCHGGEETESGFDMSKRVTLLQGGEHGPAVVPGKSRKSLLYQLITHSRAPEMPHEQKKLSKEQIAHVATWIDNEAPYDKPLIGMGESAVAWTRRVVPADAKNYWAFRSLKDIQPPTVKNERWVRTPIDRFVLSAMEKAGVTPNAAASKRKLIRRAYFDVIGLPPTPAEVAAFLADDSPQAWEKVVDRLLASRHYGERWGRYWLDLARFGESHGFEQDYNRPYAYHYRDFVIKALNADMPYEKFIRWQLAGDEFAPDDPLAMMATGFLGSGVFPTQITANEVEPSRYDALDDMASTMGTAMLGLTIGCARCHDHKYDPIPSSDYYRLIATFSTTVRSNIELDLEPDVYRKAQAAFDKQHAPLVAALAAFERDQLPARFAKWEQTRSPSAPAKWLTLDIATHKATGGTTFRKLPDGSLLAGGKNPKNDVYTFTAKVSHGGITAIRLEALADASMKKSGPGRASNGNFALTDFAVTARPLNGKAKPVAVKLKSAIATFEQVKPQLLVKFAIDADPKSAWAVDPQFGRNHAAVFETATPAGFKEGALLTLTLKFANNAQHAIGRPRLSISTASTPVGLEGDFMPVNIAGLLAKPRGMRSPAETKSLLAWYRTTDPQWRKLNKPVQDHQAKAPKPKLTQVMVTSEGFKPIRHHTQGADFFAKTFYCKRGDSTQKAGEALPGFPQALMRTPRKEKLWQQTPPPGWRTSYRRRALANWITDLEYGAGPLLARVIVNRLWQHHLGRGIVATPSDFGSQGDEATHPELLEWMAGELVNREWKLKSLHKLIMTSAVYTQSAAPSPANAKIDRENRLFWRYERRRIEAETVRDAILAASGSLDDHMFGPGTLDENHRRRSIYFMIKRSKLISSMQVFDAPDALVSQGDRPATITAPQALHLLNSKQIRAWVKNFATRIAPKPETPTAKAVQDGYAIALGRPPGKDELAASVAFIEAQTKAYAAAKSATARQLAMADFCQVLIGLNEFIYID